MKFEFPLEVVLQYRERTEEQARLDYLEAKKDVDALLRQIDEMYGQVDQARWAAHQETQSLVSSCKIQILDEFIQGQTIKIEKARQTARNLLVIADAKYDQLVLAARELIILQKLKKKRLADFNKKNKSKEIKNLDEAATLRSHRSGGQ
jgi:flagellar export protein FliJ